MVLDQPAATFRGIPRRSSPHRARCRCQREGSRRHDAPDLCGPATPSEHRRQTLLPRAPAHRKHRLRRPRHGGAPEGKLIISGVFTRHRYMRLIAAGLLLVAAAALTWSTIEELRARRALRTDLAELGHIRYDLLNADRWIEKIVPILQTQIDQLDLKQGEASLRPMVRNALYRLLDEVKTRMSAPAPQGSKAPAGAGGFFSVAGNPMVVNMIIGALKPKVPEFTEIVLRELARPESREAVKKYITSTLSEGVKNTFGSVDLSVFNA